MKMSHLAGTLPSLLRGGPMHEQYHAFHAHHVDVDQAELPAATGGGVCVHWHDRPQVIFDPALVGRRRTEVVLHELVHALRGPAPRGQRWRHLRAREEDAVNAAVAELLVPVRELAIYCDLRADLGEGVGPDDVMREYDVTRRVAEAALDNLTRHERGNL